MRALQETWAWVVAFVDIAIFIAPMCGLWLATFLILSST